MTSMLHGGRLAGGDAIACGVWSPPGSGDHRGPIAASYPVPGNKRITTYSIQWLKRLRPAWYREDLSALLELLRQGKIKPIIAERIPLEEVIRAHELLGRGAVTGKVVLLCNTYSSRHHRQRSAAISTTQRCVQVVILVGNRLLSRPRGGRGGWRHGR